jgi:hypothetical protein
MLRSGPTHPAGTGLAGAASNRGLISCQPIAAQGIGSRHSALVSPLIQVADSGDFTPVHYLLETRVQDAGERETSSRKPQKGTKSHKDSLLCLFVAIPSANAMPDRRRPNSQLAAGP